MMPFRNIFILLLLCLAFPVSGQMIRFEADTTSGCDSLQVTFTPLVPLAARDTISEIRWEFDDGQSRVENVNDNVNLFDTVVAHYQLPGQYLPTMKINNNTVISGTRIIKVYGSPDASFTYNDTAEIVSFTIEFINTDQVDDTLTYSYQWFLSNTTGEYLNDTNWTSANFLIHTFDTTGTYQARLIVQNFLGCSDTATRSFQIEDTLEIPNFFTPNGDNINDLWIVRSNGKTVYSVKIFARTGTLVYTAETKVIIWDGRNQSGQEMAADTYFYIIEPVKKKTPTSESRAGFIYLFR
jgi:gliding motility-associated-like protein